MWTPAPVHRDAFVGPKETRVPAHGSPELIVDEDEVDEDTFDPAVDVSSMGAERRGSAQKRESDMLLAQARDLLADAAAFERGLDFTAAVARARDAAALLARMPCDRLPDAADLAAEVELERGRFDTNETAWRREVEARGAAHVAREGAEAHGHLDGLSKRRT